VDAEVHAVEPSAGSSAGGTTITVTGANLPPWTAEDAEEASKNASGDGQKVGCVFSFGASAADAWAAAVRAMNAA